ncbi:sigma-54 interaction domain-containing protein [Candidatus Zixiibacteriota bacterium]
MPEAAILYGEIVRKEERRQIEVRCPEPARCLTWRVDPGPLPTNAASTMVFVDLDDPRFSDAEFLLSVATVNKQVKIIGKSSSPDLEETIRLSKLGVSEILSSAECLQRLHDFLNELGGEAGAEEEKPSKLSIDALVGTSPQIMEIKNTIKILSDVDFPSALILGDTGTGKSLISKILHNSGTRAEHNLVEVNCSAIPDELFESELFGHIKGAFTDAKANKMGLFEYAQNGTLFLDEVGNLSASAQAKLLKILEDKTLRKVGAVDEQDINVRVVTATNLDLAVALDTGKFREDLYYRLNLLTLSIPSLRERPQDIPPLLDHYLGFYATLYGKPGITMDEAAVAAMQEYPWPGNIRELCNVIERAVLLSGNEIIRPKDILAAAKNGRISIADRQQIIIDIPAQGLTLQEIEQSVVKQVLNMCSWNKSAAAKTLGISRARLRRMIERAGLEQNRRKR